MGILDKALKTVKNVGDSLVESATNVGHQQVPLYRIMQN